MTLRARMVILAALAGLVDPLASEAQESISVTEQNALVARHCAVCHNDRARNGGLTLDGFDVERTPGNVLAMLLSKVTQGLSVNTLVSSHQDTAAKNLVATRMKGGAMMAAGVPPPSDATMYALIEALAARLGDPFVWDTRSEPASGGRQRIVASVLREASRGGEGEAAMYRLIATCMPSTREGELRVSWSPLPKAGTLMVSVDGAAPVAYTVAGMEKMGNGLPGLTPPASVVLIGGGQRTIPFPQRRLAISGLLGDAIEFSMATLPTESRQALRSCFRS